MFSGLLEKLEDLNLIVSSRMCQWVQRLLKNYIWVFWWSQSNEKKKSSISIIIVSIVALVLVLVILLLVLLLVVVVVVVAGAVTYKLYTGSVIGLW